MGNMRKIGNLGKMGNMGKIGKMGKMGILGREMGGGLVGGWVGQLGMWERRLMSGRNFNWPLPARHHNLKGPS